MTKTPCTMLNITEWSSIASANIVHHTVTNHVKRSVRSCHRKTGS